MPPFPRTRAAWLAAVGAALLVELVPGLGAAESGTHPDEALYLTIAEEMHARGAWLTATIYGDQNWVKPPLLYWMARASFAVLGPGALAGRLPVALCAAALCLLTAALARRLFGREAELPAALLCAGSFGLYRFGRVAMMDVPMALALALAAWAAYRAEDEGRPRLLLWAGVGAGASALLKGPIGPLLVLLGPGGYLLLRARPLLWSRWTAAAAGVGALVALPWYAASLAVHGRAFFDAFLWGEHVAKFTREPYSARSFEQLLAGFAGLPFPWTLLFLAGLLRLRPRADKRDLLLSLWLGSVALVFSLPAVKFSHYALAALPACALLMVRAPPPAWARHGTAAVLALLGLAVLLSVRWPAPLLARASLAGAAALLSAAGLLVARGLRAPAGAAVAGALALVFGVALPRSSPPSYPADKLAAAGGRPLYAFNAHAAFINESSPSPVLRAWDPEHLAGALHSGAWVVIRARDFQELPEPVRGGAAVRERWYRLGPVEDARTLWRSWRRADPSELYEEMLLVAKVPPEG